MLFIVVGAAFDFSDGFSARLFGVSSPIGKELDSLADCVTFGFAPASFLFYELSVIGRSGGQDTLVSVVPCAAFILAAFSAVRLAKFNIDARQTSSFIGLPTPANALFWASLLTAYGRWFENMAYGTAVLLIMMLASCYLLVAKIPMFAMKFKYWGLREENNLLKYGFICFAAVVFIVSMLAGRAIGSIAFIVLAYILVSVIMWIKSK